MDTGINHHDIARHHVVRIRKYYSVLVFAQLVLAATTLGLMLPYTGPEADWPGLYRFLTFVVNAFPASGFLSQFAKTDLDECMSTFVICTYYLVGTHLFPPLYCCWAWLVCCVWQLMVWVSVWVDITYNAGRISQQLNIKGDNYWLTDNEYAETVWMRRVAMRYYTAAVVSGIHAVLTVVCLVMYARALDHHRHSGAPYVFHGSWRTTDNPNARDSGNEDSAVGGEYQDPFADGHAGYGFPSAPPQSFEMQPQQHRDAPQPIILKDF